MSHHRDQGKAFAINERNTRKLYQMRHVINSSFNKEEITMKQYSEKEVFVRDYENTIRLMEEGTFDVVDGVANQIFSIYRYYKASGSKREAYKLIHQEVSHFCTIRLNEKSNADAGALYYMVKGLPSYAKSEDLANHYIYLMVYQLRKFIEISAELEVGCMTFEERQEYETPMAYLYDHIAWRGITETGWVLNEADLHEDFENPFVDMDSSYPGIDTDSPYPAVKED